MTIFSAALTQHFSQWTAWKARASTLGFSTKYDSDGVTYTIYGYDGIDVHVCTIWLGEVPDGVLPTYSQAQNDADKSDFETNYKPGANGRTAPPTAGDVPLYAPTFMHISEKARLHGYKFVATPNGTAILDIEVTTQLLVQGGQFWITSPELGDIMHFAVVDKNDVLGLHTLNNIPLGTPIELVRYVKDYYLPSTTLWHDAVVMPTVAPVMVGLFLRVQYDAANSGVDRNVGVLFRWYEEA